MSRQGIYLRDIEAADLDTLFEFQQDPEANWLAAFVPRDPKDRSAFDAHWAKLLSSPKIVQRTIVADGRIAGHIACFPDGEHFEVTYWLGREFWGKGVGTQALLELLRLVEARPLFGRAATDNHGSVRVLQKCGFEIVGRDKGFAKARGEETEEYILRLDRAPQSGGLG